MVFRVLIKKQWVGNRRETPFEEERKIRIYVLEAEQKIDSGQTMKE